MRALLVLYICTISFFFLKYAELRETVKRPVVVGIEITYAPISIFP